PPPTSAHFPYTTLFRSATLPRKTIRPGFFAATNRSAAAWAVLKAPSRLTRSSAAHCCGVIFLKLTGVTVAALTMTRDGVAPNSRSEEHTSELQSLAYLV